MVHLFQLEYFVILKMISYSCLTEFLDLPIANGFTIFHNSARGRRGYRGDEDDCVSRWKVLQYRDPHVKDETVSRPSYL